MYPKREVVERVRKQYPSGAKVVLVHMDDVQAPAPGTKGTVIDVDAIGTVHVKWENGSTLGAVYGEDTIKLI